ncbi:hypothetical protein KIH39_12745 [Telmatocola sphagniphila]|uniref:Uncharacterized protein n=1 Tax=Telmatocola sphagniphila TaxID=1123043 RepID=A0A8E6EX58_9BACT|nr:hypothetical protein [Telmatocola sphagniphila]QVL34735.1 hypothetical protein KIH39_12745 [Telmatocola sphagniphila]
MNPPPLPSDSTFPVQPPPEIPKSGPGGKSAGNVAGGVAAASLNPPPSPGGPAKPSTDRKYPCVECGARMEYDPEAKALKCPYCGHIDKIPVKSTEKVEERDYEAYLKKLEQQKKGSLGDKAVQVKCTGCGAMVTFDDKIVADQCPYCHTHLENLPQKADEVILPESVLPFAVSNRDAINKFQEWVKSLWFAPNALKDLANIGQLQGIYLPYFTYDAMTHTYYDGRRGVRYTVSETDSDGKSRTVTRVDWTFVSGEIEHFFDDVLICSSRRLPQKLVDGLISWDLEHLVPFTPDFLSGFKTERYTIELPEGFQLAKNIMENHLVALCKRDIGGDEQQLLHRQTNYMGISFKHLLLPVWMASYRFNENNYQVLVNGRTGEVKGFRPYSIWKIIRLVVIILAIVGLGIYLTRSKHNHPRNNVPQINIPSKFGQASPSHFRRDHSTVSRNSITPKSHQESARFQV